jgi:hypothetical protein
MDDFQETLSLVVDKLDRDLSTKVGPPRGSRRPIETIFDRAHTILKIFELTEDKTYLRLWLPYFIENAERSEGFARYRFSQTMPRNPFDADTNGYGMLYWIMAEYNDLDIPDEFSTLNNLKQFEGLVDKSGGIKTWFDKEPNDVDPIVNTTAAYCYLLKHKSDSEVFAGIKEYLNSCLTGLSKSSKISRYYDGKGGGLYLAERAAKLAVYDSDFLTEDAAASLDELLVKAKSRSVLEAARISKACSQRELHQRAHEFNLQIENKRRDDGFWPWAVFYRQNTPRCNYGSEIIVTLTALEALQMEKEGVKKVRY